MTSDADRDEAAEFERLRSLWSERRQESLRTLRDLPAFTASEAVTTLLRLQEKQAKHLGLDGSA